jgi:hypothetical protein
LVLSDRFFGGGVDTIYVFRFIGQLALAAFFSLCVVSVAWSASSLGYCSYETGEYSFGTQSKAYAACENNLSSDSTVTPPSTATVLDACTLYLDTSGSGYVYCYQVHKVVPGVGDGYPSGCYAFTGALQTPCSMLTNSTSWVQGKVLDGYFTSVEDQFGNMCRVNLQPVTPPMTCGSGWCTLVEYNPVTNGPDTSPVTPAGSVDNSNGQPAQPDVPDYPASGSSAPSNPPPTICGGGSCYDPSTGNACAVGASGQVCINVANGSGTTQGGCSSSGATTICGGSPTPPSPVGSSGSTISDPPSQIQGSDTYTNANPSTGQTGSTTVNVFSSGGDTSNGSTSTSISTGKGSTSTKNGQSGPASSSSTGNGDSFNGGGDCNTPPVCQGDAVMCGVAQEAWHTSCNVTIQTTALAGSNPTQQPPNFASDLTKYGSSDVFQQSNGGGGTVGDSANQGSYDQSGFGYANACPLTDLSITLVRGSFVVPFSDACVIGPWIYWTVIGFSLYRAAKITAGSLV